MKVSAPLGFEVAATPEDVLETIRQYRRPCVKDQISLIVIAHPDDEILGFGGVGSTLAENGEIIQPVILSVEVDIRSLKPSNKELHSDMLLANRTVGFMEPVLGSFPNIRMNTVPHVDVVQFIECQIERFQPARIFTHHPGDLNDDHVQVSKACQAAARLFQRRSDVQPLEELYFMEILSSTEWSFASGSSAFQPNTFVEIGERGVERKIEALSCYRNVMRDFPHPRSAEALRGLAAYRGAQAGLDYAEAFQLVFKRGL